MKTEHLTKYVSSYGIKQICTKNKSINNNIFYVNINDVYLSNFVNHYLPNIDEPFTLVSNDGDYYFDSNFLNSYYVKEIIKNDKLRQWFIQNLYVDHPKLRHLPIGQDYHTLYLHNNAWGVRGRFTPFYQENFIENILLNSPDLQNRELIAHCNWHFYLDRGDRNDCFNSIEHSSCYFEPSKANRFDTWKTQSKMAFVVSPFGGGPDCHRTWEAISLGCIPILKRSPLSPVFDGLPCVFVDDWREVNISFLENSLESILNKTYNFSPMFLQYWKSEIGVEKSFNTNNMIFKSMKTIYYI